MYTTPLQQRAASVTLEQNGSYGGILIDDTTAITGTFTQLIVMADATFTTLTSAYTKNGAATLAVGADWGTLTTGTILSGVFSAVTLATGSVLLLSAKV